MLCILRSAVVTQIVIRKLEPWYSISLFMSADDKLRLDKWLWAARFFKTRNLAATAVTGGKVHVNTQRIKCSHLVGSGDEVRIRKGSEEFTVHVQSVYPKRRAASEAQKMYLETTESIEARKEVASQMKLLAAQSPGIKRRPNKKERRHIIRFIRKQ